MALAVAAAARLVAPNWDAGIAAHPDERFLLGAAAATPLLGNPCRTTPDFPYGHLPVMIVRLIVLASGGADPLYAARLLSGLIGVLLVALSGACGRMLGGWRAATFALWVTALSPGLIQQGHFYTVDPLGAVLAAGSVLAAARARWRWAGVLSGLAIACKASLATSAVALVVALWLAGRRAGAGAGVRVLLGFVLPCFVAFASVSPWSVATPVACWRGPWMQAMLASGRWVFPYTQQYAGTWPWVYPLVQLALWGLGPVVAVLGAVGLAMRVGPARRGRLAGARPDLVWGILFFGATAALRVKFPRYLLPLTPWWGAWAGRLLWGGRRTWAPWVRTTLAMAGAASTALLGIAQVGVYTQIHPWVRASAWLEANLPAGAEVVVEAWDHPLPVPLPGSHTGNLRQVTLDVYAEEEMAKAAALADASRAATTVLASRRGYGALSREPARYPETMAWYAKGLTEREVHAFVRCPRVGQVAITDDPLADAGLPVPVSLAQRCGTKWAMRLPRLDESYRVYDAPLALVLTRD